MHDKLPVNNPAVDYKTLGKLFNELASILQENTRLYGEEESFKMFMASFCGIVSKRGI